MPWAEGSYLPELWLLRSVGEAEGEMFEGHSHESQIGNQAKANLHPDDRKKGLRVVFKFIDLEDPHWVA